MVAPFELSPDTQRLAEQLARPPRSVFAGERDALREELQGRTPQQALAALRTQELRYRDLLYGVVGQVLPPQIRARIPELLEAFNAIDRAIYNRPESEAPSGTADFPVRDLPDNGRLRPIVHKVTVRSAGGDEILGRRLRPRSGGLDARADLPGRTGHRVRPQMPIDLARLAAAAMTRWIAESRRLAGVLGLLGPQLAERLERITALETRPAPSRCLLLKAWRSTFAFTRNSTAIRN